MTISRSPNNQQAPKEFAFAGADQGGYSDANATPMDWSRVPQVLGPTTHLGAHPGEFIDVPKVICVRDGRK